MYRCIALTLLSVPAVGQPVQQRVEFGAEQASLDEWTVKGPTPREQQIELMFGVKQRNLKQLHDSLMLVSDPASANYGQHLSNAQVHELTAPDSRHTAAVMEYLAQYGVQGRAVTPNADMIAAIMPVATAEKLLSARYMSIQRNTSTSRTVHRTIYGYSLPADVAGAVDFVSPTTHLPGDAQPVSLTELTAGSLNNIPKTLRKLYNVGDVVGKAVENKQAVTAFLGQYYSETALKQFVSEYCSGITCGKGMPKLVGDATTGSPGVESMLDIEYITGVGGNIETEFWGFSGKSQYDPENEPFLKWLAAVSNTSDSDVPKLFSSSYGEGESTWPLEAAERLNAEFMKAGARGISLLFASGDSGASCKSGKFTPNMPASSPYVTAVGGTEPASGFPEPGSESAIGLSSGGFSNYFATPTWQKEAVHAYLMQPGLPPLSRGFNTSGRAFPDIAAQATNFCVTPFGCGVAGTSCASPTAAGIFGLLNDLRLQSGKSTLGFLNPLLYSNADSFNDITSGSSDGCTFSKGWPAKKGWDAVTGLGTPDYAKLADMVKSLPGSSLKEAAVIV